MKRVFPQIRIRFVIYAIVGLVAFAALGFAIWDSGSGHDYAEVMPFAGAMLVATGWMVTNEISVRNSRRQHTITMISDYMLRAERIRDSETIRKYLPKTTSLISEINNLNYDDETHELLIAA